MIIIDKCGHDSHAGSQDHAMQIWEFPQPWGSPHSWMVDVMKIPSIKMDEDKNWGGGYSYDESESSMLLAGSLLIIIYVVGIFFVIMNLFYAIIVSTLSDAKIEEDAKQKKKWGATWMPSLKPWEFGMEIGDLTMIY